MSFARGRLATAGAVLAVAGTLTGAADAHLVKVPDNPKMTVQENRHASQTVNLAHAVYVCRRGGGKHKRWACWAASSVVNAKTGQGWLRRLWEQSVPVAWYIAKQIRVANDLAKNSEKDPWPNCPDPHDGSGAPWWDPARPGDPNTTLGCENGGNWLDSPGYYRCGLQFDPGWERVYGRLCP